MTPAWALLEELELLYLTTDDQLHEAHRFWPRRLALSTRRMACPYLFPGVPPPAVSGSQAGGDAMIHGVVGLEEPELLHLTTGDRCTTGGLPVLTPMFGALPEELELPRLTTGDWL